MALVAGLFRVARTAPGVAGFEVELRISRTQAGDDALTLVRDQVVDGVSIGFNAVHDTWSADRSRRTLREVRLNEISLVHAQAYNEAKVLAVRSRTAPSLMAARRQLLELQRARSPVVDLRSRVIALNTERMKAWEQAKGLLDAVDAQGRDMSPEERAAWQRMNATISDLDAQVRELVAVEQRDVASPCTAPFMGAALGYAIAQPLPSTLAVFVALGLGMALPYVLLAWFPGWRRSLQKPGAWMERVKQFLAFPLYATVAWLAWVLGAPARGASTAQAVPGTMLITAAVFALASLPTFLLLRERAVPVPPSELQSHALARLARSARETAAHRDLLAVFACGTFYQAGVATVIALAAIYAQQVMGFETKDTILLILAVSVTAALGAFGFGYAQDRIGKVPALRVTLFAWLAMIVAAWMATTPALFWVAANLAGLAMGSSQSAGRALVSYFSDIRPYFAEAGIYVAPLRLGRGVQNKVLEAMAMQLPVVAGLAAEDGTHVLVADPPEQFAAAVVSLFRNPQRAAALSANAGRLISERYTWEANLELLDEVLAARSPFAEEPAYVLGKHAATSCP